MTSSPGAAPPAVPAPAAPKRTGLKTSAILNWISLGLNFAVSFVVTPIIIHKLGSTGFGMWVLIQSFSGYYGLVNLGLASALQRFVSRDLATGDMPSVQATVGTAMMFFSGTGLLVVIAAMTLADGAARFFEINAVDAPAFAATLLFCAIAVVADFFGSIMTTLFTARERFDLSNGLSIGRQLAQATGILLVLFYRPSINAIALVVCSISLVSLLLGWRLAGRLYTEVRLTWRGGRYDRLKELLHYGSSTVLLTISNIVRLRLGNLVIAKTTGLAAVGTFSVASNLVLNMNSIVTSSLNMLNPRFTRLHTQMNMPELQRLYRMALFGASTMACGMGLMMLVFGERFIVFWVGKEFLPSVPILHVLTIAYVFALAQAPSWNLMFALAKHHFMARVTIAEAAGIVVLGLWLSHRYGALGFAWATALSMLVTKVLLHAPYAARIASMSLPQYLAPLAIPFLSVTVLYGLSRLLGIDRLLRENGPALFLGLAAAYALVYAGLVGLLARRQDYVPDFIASRFRRLKP